MNRIFYCLLLVFIFQLSYSQEEIILTYDKDSKSVLTSVKKLKKNNKYSIKIKGINSAHVEKISEVKQSNFVSEIPEILKPIYSGVTDNSVFDFFKIDTIGQRKAYLNAIRFFNKLESIRGLSDQLYNSTNFSPNIGKANDIKKQIIDSFNSGVKQNQKLKTLDEIQSQLFFFQEYIGKLSISYKKALKNISLEHPDFDVILKEFATLERINDKIKKTNYLGKLNFVKLSQKSSDTLDIVKFTAKKDVIDVELKLYNNYTKDTVYNDRISFKTFNKFSFDFTTGFFYTDIVEPKYFIESRDEAINNVKEEEINNIDISIGGLGHFTYEFDPYFKAGISLGASLSPFDGNLRYLVGPSFVLGYEKQVALSFGLAVSKIDQLSDAIKKDDTGYYVPSTINEVSTVKKIQKGFFIGLTYNLISKKK